jgi:hypothetical protein
VPCSAVHKTIKCLDQHQQRTRLPRCSQRQRYGTRREVEKGSQPPSNRSTGYEHETDRGGVRRSVVTDHPPPAEQSQQLIHRARTCTGRGSENGGSAAKARGWQVAKRFELIKGERERCWDEGLSHQPSARDRGLDRGSVASDRGVAVAVSPFPSSATMEYVCWGDGRNRGQWKRN